MAQKIEITPQPNYVLPAGNSDLQSFCQKFRVDMMEQTVSSIEYAIKNKLSHVEVFQFKNSDFVITLSDKDYLSNLDNIYKYYMDHEVYENCLRVSQLQKTLTENSIYNTDEKTKR